MAAALMRRQFDAFGVDARVESAGLVTEGEAASEYASAVLADMGVELGMHRSRRINVESIASADLIVGMERAHVREVVTISPPAFGRSFTLKEIVRRAEAVGPREGSESLPDWLERVHLGRKAAALLGADRDDDIADPYGRSRAVYAGTAAQLETLEERLVLLAWGSAS
jgi:protein-tyrosine phosphatase